MVKSLTFKTAGGTGFTSDDGGGVLGVSSFGFSPPDSGLSVVGLFGLFELFELLGLAGSLGLSGRSKGFGGVLPRSLSL